MMTQLCLSSFEDPAWHAQVMRIIRGHSANRTDVREEALRGLDIASCQSILDLGCGFGSDGYEKAALLS